MNPSDYISINKVTWNEKTRHHVTSDFYDQESFLAGKSSLKSIELALLGDVSQKKILHLQCHFGQDTLSLARMGAQVTGLDFSDEAIGIAQKTAKQLELDANFVCCDVYEAKKHINEKFDIVFTSYGTIGWLPDLDRWAEVIAHFLKPGGQFIFVEFHPVVWMFDDDFEQIAYNYSKSEPIIESVEGTYADREADMVTKTVSWNHSLSEVMTSLLDQGLQIENFKEYNFSPYNCFNKTVKIEEDKFRIAHLSDFIPMVYSIVSVKK